MIIVARHDEDITWSKPLSNVVIIQKGRELPNIGRESSSYLWYICDQYEHLEGSYFFVQGDPFYHSEIDFTDTTPRFFGSLALTDEDGGTRHRGIGVDKFAKQAGMNVQYPYWFTNSGQFCVSAEYLHSHSKSFYESLYEMHYEYEKAPWIMERLWKWLFPYLQPSRVLLPLHIHS